MTEKIIIGFDFSINKPAATIYYRRKIYTFIWPLELTKYENELYKKLTDRDFYCANRNLDSISKSSKMSTSEMVIEHTKRSIELSYAIINQIKIFINNNNVLDDDYEIYIVSEGLSFGSKGNSTLDLATYKGVLMSKIYEQWKNVKMYTYSPMTIKSVAGASKKEDRGDKHAMIKKFIENGPKDSTLWKNLNNGNLSRTNKKGGIEYYHCVDDMVDSYFAVMTLIEKEGIDI